MTNQNNYLLIWLQLRDMVLRAAARYNLPIRWLPDRMAEQNFNIEEPPTRASPWVKVSSTPELALTALLSQVFLHLMDSNEEQRGSQEPSVVEMEKWDRVGPLSECHVLFCLILLRWKFLSTPSQQIKLLLDLQCDA